MPEEPNPRKCPRCGAAIPEGIAECPHCANRWSLVLHSRETVLSLCILGLIIFFLVTGAIVSNYHQKLQSLGIEWFKAGREQLTKNNPRAALADFRNSLVYNPDDGQVEFQLAEALSAEGRNQEAQSYLLGLLAQAPSDAPVNLALARIAARAGSEADALRYYHGAIYGIWPSDPETNQLKARFALCGFLISENDAASADSELIALQSEIPRNSASLHEQVGDFFLTIGDASRALEEFRRALGTAHPPSDALRGAGLAAYEMEDYRAAERYLGRAAREGTHDAQAMNTLEITRLILAWNPEAVGLRDSERRARVRHDLAQAISRAEACAKSSGLALSVTVAGQKAASKPSGQESSATKNSLQNQQTGANESSASGAGTSAPNLATEYALAENLQAGLSDRNLARHPETLDQAIDAIFFLETAATQKCGEPAGGLDKALEILGHDRQNGTHE
jgi:Tfp pilus assembly protein PilF